MSSNILQKLGLEDSLTDKGSHKAPAEDRSTAEPEAKVPIVHIEGARFSYGRQIILESVDMQIHNGEFWCFIGPNGEGKLP